MRAKSILKSKREPAISHITASWHELFIYYRSIKPWISHFERNLLPEPTFIDDLICPAEFIFQLLPESRERGEVRAKSILKSKREPAISHITASWHELFIYYRSIKPWISHFERNLLPEPTFIDDLICQAEFIFQLLPESTLHATGHGRNRP